MSRRFLITIAVILFLEGGTRIADQDGNDLEFVTAVSWQIRANEVGRVVLEVDGLGADVDIEGEAAPPPLDLPSLTSVQVLRPARGDTIVFSFDQILSATQVQLITARLRNVFPDQEVVVLTQGHVDAVIAGEPT